MIENEKDYLYYYNEDNNNKKINKNRYNNIKSNSPILSHQENNYYYNTKINHLILQGLSNCNGESNNYMHQPQPLYNSVYINYDKIEKNQNNKSNTIQKKMN